MAVLLLSFWKRKIVGESRKQPGKKREDFEGFMVFHV